MIFTPMIILQLIAGAAEAGIRVWSLIEALKDDDNLTPEAVRKALDQAKIPASKAEWHAKLTGQTIGEDTAQV